jgi:LytR cell envelope-related transcriptional attenuator
MVPLLALSVQDQIEKIGAYAGFAAVIGLAVLALLYFSQAREVKRLREWAGRAPERARELEDRVAQQAQAARTGAPAAAAPAQRRVVAQPIARPAQGQQAAAAASPARAAAPATVAAAAAGAAAGAATAEAEDRGDEREEAGGNGQKAVDPQATQLHQTIPPGTAPAGSGDGSGEPEEDAGERPAAAAAPLRRPAAASASPAAEAAAPETPAAAPATAAAAATGPSAPAAPPRPQRPAYAQPRPAGRATPPPRGPERPSRRRAWILGGVGVLLVAGIAAGAIALLSGGDDTPPAPNKPVASSNTKSSSKSASPSGEGAQKRGDVTVSVLNGTTITGLAADTRDRIVASGFKQGAIDTNQDQTLTETTVYYADGFEKAAQEVAALLKVKNIEPLPSQTAAIAGNADVVVVVGLDRTQ